MKIYTLIENTSCFGLPAEHGLSFYTETKSHKLLFDVGATDLFIRNAGTLGIDLSAVDTVVISHGHYDHGGGLDAFLQINDRADIYLQESAFSDHYTQKASGPEYIGLNKALMHHPQVHLLRGSCRIDEELEIYSGVVGESYPTNKNLLMTGYRRDDFVHEQHLVIHGEKEILLMGCGHKGVYNIVTQCPVRPDVVIGGFHLYSPGIGEMLPEETVAALARDLPAAVYYTGHCTGEQALEVLKREGLDVHAITTGLVIDV